MAPTSYVAWFGAATGVLGIALGVWNAWRAQALRLKVQPQVNDRSPAAAQASRFSVRVTNLSPFAVTIETVEIFCGTGQDRHPVPIESATGETLPFELGSRKALVLTMPIRATIWASMEPIDRILVRTACGAEVWSSRRHKTRGKKLSEILAGATSRR